MTRPTSFAKRSLQSEIFLEMEDVSTVGAAEQYLRGCQVLQGMNRKNRSDLCKSGRCFDYQLFNPQSTLRKFYTPAGGTQGGSWLLTPWPASPRFGSRSGG